tara:strand:+ start:73 stop:309 length:237 start_codon:yes stop_codon:yes gene_type:complete
MKVKEQNIWLIVKRTFWTHDQENWFDVSETAKSKEQAEIKKSALETLNNENKVSYLIIETKGLQKAESEEKNDEELPF